MEKKIGIAIIGLFALIFLIVTVIYFTTKKDNPPVVVEEKYNGPVLKGYSLIKNSNISDSGVDKNTLIYFNDKLYALAIDNPEIEGDLLGQLGTIDNAIYEAYIPQYNSETNDKKYLGLTVYRANEVDLIVGDGDKLVRFIVVSKY